jgi:dienelactone hydrolase
MPSLNGKATCHWNENPLMLGLAAALLVMTLVGSSHAVAETANRQLPRPTGPHAVGRTAFFWKDDARSEPNTPDEQDRRELRVDVWYPADASTSAESAKYFPDLAALSKTLGPETLLFGSIKGNTLANPPVASGTSRFPTLILSPGLGTNASQYAYLVEELVSHGYLVATVDHPYQSRAIAYPGGRVVTLAQQARSADTEQAAKDYRANIELRAGDLSFALDCLERLDAGELDPRFAGRIDRGRVGALGHSIGGITAPQACMSDVRFKAVINMDGHQRSLPFLPDEQGRGPRQPFMELTDGLPAATDQQLAQWKMTREVFERQRAETIRRVDAAMRTIAADSYRVTIPGVRHNSFSDMAIWDNDPLEVRYRRMQIIRDYVRAFFDKHLSNRADTLLDASQGPYSEVTLEKFQGTP